MSKKAVPMFSSQSAPDFDPGKDFATARQFGVLYLSDLCLYVKSLLKTEYLPLSALRWCYLRREDSTASICCGRTTFTTSFLVVVTHRGERRKIPVEQEVWATAVLEAVKAACPHIPTRYSAELEEQIPTSAGF